MVLSLWREMLLIPFVSLCMFAGGGMYESCSAACSAAIDSVAKLYGCASILGLAAAMEFIIDISLVRLSECDMVSLY